MPMLGGLNGVLDKIRWWTEVEHLAMRNVSFYFIIVKPPMTVVLGKV